MGTSRDWQRLLGHLPWCLGNWVSSVGPAGEREGTSADPIPWLVRQACLYACPEPAIWSTSPVLIFSVITKEVIGWLWPLAQQLASHWATCLPAYGLHCAECVYIFAILLFLLFLHLLLTYPKSVFLPTGDAFPGSNWNSTWSSRPCLNPTYCPAQISQPSLAIAFSSLISSWGQRCHHLVTFHVSHGEPPEGRELEF